MITFHRGKSLVFEMNYMVMEEASGSKGAILGHGRNIRIKSVATGAKLPVSEINSATYYVSHITFLCLTCERGIN